MTEENIETESKSSQKYLKYFIVEQPDGDQLCFADPKLSYEENPPPFSYYGEVKITSIDHGVVKVEAFGEHSRGKVDSKLICKLLASLEGLSGCLFVTSLITGE